MLPRCLFPVIRLRFIPVFPPFSRPALSSSPRSFTTMSSCTPSIDDALSVLKSRFHFPDFRGGQRRVIELLLSDTPTEQIPQNRTGRALAIFPTGSGKSLCYQLPALLFNDGLTLVVSPLMALMKDQVDSLVRKDISAACLDSSLSALETRELYERIVVGDISILFVSPERFNNLRFIVAIRKVSVALFAVDEAHCISEWGHSFRPDYLRLSRWADRLGVRRRLALTATATPAVARDICNALSIPFPEAQVRTPSTRPNLTTRVTVVPPVSAKASATAEDAILPRVELLASRLREREPGPTIIYVSLQSTATLVADMLRRRGYAQALSYHGGMHKDDRKRVQDEFMANTRDAMVVATIAFGMGMDHPSIRYVYHVNMPKSIEGYIQEIGRAGRDGLPSVCESFVSVDDLNVLEGFIYGETPSRSAVHSLIEDLFAEAKVGKEIEYSQYDLCFENDVRDTSLGQILAQLDLSEGLIEETTPYFSLIDCAMLNGKAPQLRNSHAGYAVMAAGVKKKKYITIDVKHAAEKTGMEYGRISRICDDLVNEGHLESCKSRKLTHRSTVKKMPDDTRAVADRIYAILVKSRNRQIFRLGQVVEYFSAQECQTLFLARHLGDKADSEGSCGHCEYCMRVESQPPDFKRMVDNRERKPLDERRWALVQLADLPRNDPYLIARFAAGISSPIIARKFRKLSAFGSMSDHDFKVLLQAAEKECGVS